MTAPPSSPAAAPPETLPVSVAPTTRAAFGRYRVMAFVTGTFLLLLCAEMVLKYVFQVNGVDENGEPRAVLGMWIAIVHGWIYVIYAVTCLQLWSKARWGLGRLVWMILGGIVPVMSFVVEAYAARWPALVRVRRAATVVVLADDAVAAPGSTGALADGAASLAPNAAPAAAGAASEAPAAGEAPVAPAAGDPAPAPTPTDRTEPRA